MDHLTEGTSGRLHSSGLSLRFSVVRLASIQFNEHGYGYLNYSTSLEAGYAG
jgi:hypothetical protein